jgi:hypothetical protein
METLHHPMNPMREAGRGDGLKRSVNSLKNVRIGIFSAEDGGIGLEEDLEEDSDEDVFAG